MEDHILIAHIRPGHTICPRCGDSVKMAEGRLGRHFMYGGLATCPASALTMEGAQEVANGYRERCNAFEKYREECRAYFASQR